MRNADRVKGLSAGVELQPKSSLKALSGRCSRDGGRKTLQCGSFIIATVGILAVVTVFMGSIVFAMSVLVRNERLTRDLSTNGLTFLAGIEPAPGMLLFGKTSRLADSSPREELTADAILAAYRRTLASPMARQDRAPLFQIAANTEDHRETAAPQSGDNPSVSSVGTASASDDPRQVTPYTDGSAVADATARMDKLFPLPVAKPPSEGRHMGASNQRDLPSAVDKGRIAMQAGTRLADLPEHNSVASGRTTPDAGVRSSFPWPDRNSRVAIYDISAGTVYLPNGERLEAHSGVGRMRDNPSFVRVKMLGPTPPATYVLSLREEAFHGVDAIRLTPVNGNAPFGRDGLLAHTYMLRRPGDSNGCVVFANYNRFLKAFRNNEVNQMVVVPQMQERLSGLPSLPIQG